MTDPKIVEGAATLKHTMTGYAEYDSEESPFEADPFGAEFSAPEVDPNKIQFDKWGRYSNLPAVPGYGPRPWLRVSDLKKVLDDQSLLEKWRLRQVLIGIKRRPELLEKITPGMVDAIDNHRTDPMSYMVKKKLNDLVELALDAAGIHQGAEEGTAFHELMEVIDAAENPVTGALDLIEKRSNPHPLSDDDKTMIDAYAALLVRHQIKMIPDMIERVIVCPEIGVAGRLDRVLLDDVTGANGDILGTPRIGDVKSQASMNFGHVSLAVQLACYANATYMLDMSELPWKWEPMYPVDTDLGVILWTPVTQPGVAEVYDVDLVKGWKIAKASARALEWQQDKTLVTRRA